MIILIAGYVIINSYCMKNFGYTSPMSFIADTVFSAILLALIIISKKSKYYGLTKAENSNKFLYFIPLIVIGTVGLWNGVNIKNSASEILFHILTMINVGFLEEIIFRGILYKSIEKDNKRLAMIISSITFGIGHIVNLLNGADLIPTLVQICYAIALGFLFVTIFDKCKSLIPCIVTHMMINSLSVLGAENTAISTYYVIGSPSLEMYIKSYNQVPHTVGNYTMGFTYKSTSVPGYAYSMNRVNKGSETGEDSLDYIDYYNMYCGRNNSRRGKWYTWLASPSAKSNSHVCRVNGNSGGLYDGAYDSYILMGQTNNLGLIGQIGKGTTEKTIISKDTNKHIFRLDTVANKASIDSTMIDLDASELKTIWYNYYLFALDNKVDIKNNAYFKMYSCKITEDNKTILDLIPCLDPEGIACLYDKVSKKCFYNDGTGTFKYEK